MNDLLNLQESTNILQWYINKHLTYFPRLYFNNSVLVLKYIYIFFFKALGCRCGSSVPISPTPKRFFTVICEDKCLKEVIIIKLILMFPCKITLSPYVNIDSSTQFDVNDFFTQKHKSFTPVFILPLQSL